MVEKFYYQVSDVVDLVLFVGIFGMITSFIGAGVGLLVHKLLSLVIEPGWAFIISFSAGMIVGGVLFFLVIYDAFFSKELD